MPSVASPTTASRPAATPTRARERDRRALWSAAVTLLCRVVSYGVVIASVPLALRYLGDSGYGVWVTVSGLLLWLVFLDFGLGSTLRQQLGAVAVAEDRALVQTQVSTVFWLLVAGALALGALGAAGFWAVPWRDVLNPGGTVTDHELRLTLGVVLLVVLVRLPVLIVPAIYAAYQRSHVAALWDAGGALVGYLALRAVTGTAGGLPAIALAVAGTALLGNLLAAAFLFGRDMPWTRPRLLHWHGETARRSVRVGWGFMVLQLATVIIYHSDNLITARVLGARAVTVYELAYRPFWLVLSVQMVLLAPFLPVFNEAYLTGEIPWLRARLRRLAWAAVGAGALVIAGATTLGPTLLALWVGPESRVLYDPTLVAVLGAWCAVYLLTACYSSFLVGIGAVRRISWIAIASAPVNVVLCVVLARRMGVTGIAVANLLTLALGTLPAARETYALLRDAESRLATGGAR